MVVGIILAAGLSRRMGDINKLTKPWKDKPLVRHVYDAAKGSRLDKVIVVGGFEAGKIEAVLAGADVVHNSDFETGIAGSIKTGVEAAGNANGVMILLGDMPLVTSLHINKMIDSFQGQEGAIVAAVTSGALGNPVLFGQEFFDALTSLEGDRGARKIIESYDRLIKVEIGEAGVRDFDTTQAFED